MAIDEPDRDKYDPWKRAFSGMIELEPLIRGIDDYETAIHAHQLAHEFDADAEHKEEIAEKLREFKDE